MVDKLEKFESLLNYMIREKYLEKSDILYNQRYGFNFSVEEFNNFLTYKKNEAINFNQIRKDIKLNTFDGKNIYYFNCRELLDYFQLYLNSISDDFEKHNSLIATRYQSEIIRSRIYSEIEGTLSIEAVNSTRKRIDELTREKIQPQNLNDHIIKNMVKAVDFVLTKPTFNKENLFKLYCILSEECLEDDYKLRSGEYYRYDEVEVDSYNGCPHDKIESCMDSLFEYVNNQISKGDNMTNVVLPNIAHFYIVYIHPYFDYNGRTARMVSFWISLLANSLMVPVLSEAIDDTKNKYYQALRNTRDSNNDLTYFLIYIFKILVNQTNCYKNIEYADTILKNKNIVLTENEKVHLKKIMVNSKGKFTYKDFAAWIKNDITKQGAFKILNEFTDYGLLTASEAKSKVKLFEINIDMLPYRLEKI